jgi:hypothetical protein
MKSSVSIAFAAVVLASALVADSSSPLMPVALMIDHHFSISAFCRQRALPASATRAGNLLAYFGRAPIQTTIVKSGK